MKRLYSPLFLILILLLFSHIISSAQSDCNLVNKLSINTGYNHITSSTIAHNQPDTFWKVTAISTASASYFSAIPSLPYSSYTVIGRYWPTRTATSEWISFLPNGTYTEIPPHPVDSLWTEYSRDFRICEEDSILFKLDITNDNFCKKVLVDGIPVPPGSPFTQPSSLATVYHTSWTTIPAFKLKLSKGVHRISFVIHNYPVGRVTDNPVGFSIKGDISSTTSRNSIVGYASMPDCKCICVLSTVKASPKDTSACNDIVLQLAATGAVSYSWGPTVGLDNPNIPNPKLTTSSSGKYVVIGIDTAGCIGSDTVNVHINSNPIVVVKPADTSVCSNTPLQLQASGAYTYSWLPSVDLDNPNIYNPIFKSNSSGVQFVQVKGIDLNGCIGFDSIEIKVNSNPLIDASPDLSLLCEGATIQLLGNGGLKYSWTPITGLNNSFIANPKLTIQSSILKYFLTGVDANGCSGIDSIEINLTPGPKVIVKPKDTIACAGTMFQLKATGAKWYTWSPSSGLSNDTISNPILTMGGNYKLVVAGRDSLGCVGYDTMSISSMPLPTINAIQKTLSEDCGSNLVQLNATGAQSYKWYPAIYTDYDTVSNPVVKIPNNIVFTVTGIGTNGCLNTDTITVFYKGKSAIRMPNAFTPNADLINDVIRPVIVCDFILDRYSIYNKWGQQVYTTQNILQGWDGILDGKPCEMGVYYYLIQGKSVDGEEILMKGDITLIR